MRRFIFEASNQFATVIRREHPGGDYVLYDALASVEKAREEERRDNNTLRLLLAVAHAGHYLYADDGELRDATARPHIDFKRDSVAEIQRKIMERNSIKLTPPTEG